MGDIYTLFFEPFGQAGSVEDVAAVGDLHEVVGGDRAEADHAVSIDVFVFMHEVVGGNLPLGEDVSA